MVRAELNWFVAQMERKLKENSYKGSWINCSKEFLKNKLREELIELLYELEQPKNDLVKVIDEAADLANICMMVSDISRRELREEIVGGDDDQSDN